MSETKSIIGINPDIEAFLDAKDFTAGLPFDEKKKFLEEAHSLSESKVLLTIINDLINEQACHSILQAPDSNVIMFDRAGINVLVLLKEKIKKLSGDYANLTKSEDDFDQNEVI